MQSAVDSILPRSSFQHRFSALRLGVLAVTLALLACLTALPSPAYADIASDTSGSCSWIIDDDGNLTVSPTNGSAGTLGRYGSNGWSSYRERITSVYFEPGVSASSASGLLMFYGCENLVTADLSNLNMNPIDDASLMFGYCQNLESVNLGDNTLPNCTSTYGMFVGCSKLGTFDASKLNTSRVTDFEGMFYGCESLEELDVSNFNTSNATSLRVMFWGCAGLDTIDVSNFDTSKVTDMAGLFGQCSSLSSVDLSSFDTSKVTDMMSMFFMCGSLTSLDVSNFDTSNVTRMRNMFDRTGLASIDVSNFDTSNVTEMSFMFNIPELRQITLGPDFSFNVSGQGFPILPGGSWTTDPALSEDATYYPAQFLEDTYDGASMAGTYYKLSAEYMALELGQENLWRVSDPTQRFKGYCMNLMREGVFGYYDRVLADDDFLEGTILDSADTGSTHGFAPMGATLREALIALIYYGWPNDADGIQVQFGLADDEYMSVTQEAIWDFTNRYDNKYGPSSLEGAQLQAYNALVSKKYADIGGDYDLYVYQAESSIRQNLLSIAGVQPEGEQRGGIKVVKYDEYGDALLQGAEFTIYRAANEDAALAGEGEAVAVIETEASGVASTSADALPLGWYVVRETKPAPGYLLDSDTYYATFLEVAGYIESSGFCFEGGVQVTDGADSQTDLLTIAFFDEEDTSFEGGGLRVHKQDESGGPLSGAEFEIVQGDTVVKTLLTDAQGYAETGRRELPLGTYTVRESKAPLGYFKLDEERTVTIANNNDFVTEGLSFVDTAKVGSATIVAQKMLEGDGATLEAGAYTFVLRDFDGNEIDRATNDAEGKVAFGAIAYGPADLGYKNYTIVEVAGTDEHTTYDKHEEFVTVVIEDDGSDSLQCYVRIDEDGPTFTNTYDKPEESRSELQPASNVSVDLVKHLQDALIHAEEFSFGLYDEDGMLVGKASTTLGVKTGNDEYSSSVSIAFNGLKFEKAGTYRYTIREHVEGATEVVAGDTNNQKGFEPGFYKGGVRYDDKEYEVVVNVAEVDGVLHATVDYPGSDGSQAHELHNVYSEEFVEIDGHDSHPNDGLHEQAPSDEPKPAEKEEEQPGQKEEQQGELNGGDELTPAPAPAPKSPEEKVSAPKKANTPAPKSAPSSAKKSAPTGDAAPVLPLVLAALVTAGASGLAWRRRRES